MSDIRTDDDGFLLGDGEVEHPKQDAESGLLREVKNDTSTIVNLLRSTVKLQRDALSAQRVSANPQLRPIHQQNQPTQRVSLIHPERTANDQTPLNNGGDQWGDVPTLSPLLRPTSQSVSPTPKNNSDTLRLNRERDSNGRFVRERTPSDIVPNIIQEHENTQSRNRDSRGRFNGGGVNADERGIASKITDGLKGLNHNLTLNADTSHIDPMIDAVREASGIVGASIDAGKKVLSVGNTLIAKPAMALGRGIKGFFKPKADTQSINSPTTWYKRIWRTLTWSGRQAHTDHSQEQRRLDEINSNTDPRNNRANGGLLGLVGAALLAALAKLQNFKLPEMPDWFKPKNNPFARKDNSAPIPVFRVPKVPITALPPTRTQSLIMRLGESRVGKAVGMVAKKLPFIASGLALGGGGINAYNIAHDNVLTKAEKERAQAANVGKTGGSIVGGLGGAVMGASIGTAIMPVVGTVIGGLIGSWLGTDAGAIVGEKIGGWVDDLSNADITGRIEAAWQGFITPLTPMFMSIHDYALGVFNDVGVYAKNKWQVITEAWSDFVADVKLQFGGVLAGFSAIGDFFSGIADTANTWIKEKTGIDVQANLKGSKEAVIDIVSRHVVQPVAEKVKVIASAVQRNVSSIGQGIADAPIVKAVGGMFTGLSTETAKEKNAKKMPLPVNANSYDSMMQSTYEGAGFHSPQEKSFLKAQVHQESSFDPLAVNKESGAFGLTQFMPKTAKQYGVKQGNSQKAVQSQIKGQAQYMSYLVTRYGGDWEKALAGYNYGEGNLDKKLKQAQEKGVNWKKLLPVETQDYLTDIKRKAVLYGAKTVSPPSPAMVEKSATLPKQANAETVVPKLVLPPVATQPTHTPPSIKVAPHVTSVSTNVQSIPSVQAQAPQQRISSTPTPLKISIPKALVGQNVGDRGIAHILTGGIGEMMA